MIGIKGVSELFGYSRQAYYKNKSSRKKRYSELLIVRDIVMQILCSMQELELARCIF
jgi:hypothetical protein